MKTINNFVNEKLKLNSQSQLKKEYGDDWKSMCHLIYDKIYEWHKEFLKNKRLLNSFVNWFRDAIDSITGHGVSDYNVYDNIISELFSVNKISKEDYDKLKNHKDIDKIIEFCLFIMVKIINNSNQLMEPFSNVIKETKTLVN